MLRRSLLASALVVALVGAGCNGPPPPSNPRNVETPSDKFASRPAEQPAEKPPEKPIEKPPEKPPTPPPDKPSLAPPPSPPANPAATLTKEAGAIRGVVRWTGKASPRRPVGPDGGLADAVVWIAAPPPVSTAPVPTDQTIQFSLRKGEYRPHVAAARVGTKVQIASLDGADDVVVTGASAFSGTLTPGDPPASFTASNAGWVEIRSQIHLERPPAYLHVLPHSHFAVTGSDGRFQLPAVPPGEYEIVFWHESWPDGDPKTPADQRTTRTRVQLDAGAGVSLEWTLPAK